MYVCTYAYIIPDAAKAGYTGKDHKVVWKPINIVDEQNVSPFDPYSFIYGRYDTDYKLQQLYTKYPAKFDRLHPFRDVDR